MRFEAAGVDGGERVGLSAKMQKPGFQRYFMAGVPAPLCRIANMPTRAAGTTSAAPMSVGSSKGTAAGRIRTGVPYGTGRSTPIVKEKSAVMAELSTFPRFPCS